MDFARVGADVDPAAVKDRASAEDGENPSAGAGTSRVDRLPSACQPKPGVPAVYRSPVRSGPKSNGTSAGKVLQAFPAGGMLPDGGRSPESNTGK